MIAFVIVQGLSRDTDEPTAIVAPAPGPSPTFRALPSGVMRGAEPVRERRVVEPHNVEVVGRQGGAPVIVVVTVIATACLIAWATDAEPA